MRGLKLALRSCWKGMIMYEKEVADLMRCDFSQGTEAFREGLLQRCLAILDDDHRSIPLEDNELEFLAAAGDSYSSLGEQDGGIVS